MPAVAEGIERVFRDRGRVFVEYDDGHTEEFGSVAEAARVAAETISERRYVRHLALYKALAADPDLSRPDRHRRAVRIAWDEADPVRDEARSPRGKGGRPA